MSDIDMPDILYLIGTLSLRTSSIADMSMTKYTAGCLHSNCPAFKLAMGPDGNRASVVGIVVCGVGCARNHDSPTHDDSADDNRHHHGVGC